jgi:type II secretory pathway component HofQ
VIRIALALLAATAAPGDGEARLSLDVKDGEVKQIVQVLARVGELQVVFDPDVSCFLTLSVQELPWTDVLDHALRACRLGAEGSSRVLRVAPLERLERESRERRALAESRGALPKGIEMQRLSYARAEELAPVIQAMLPDGEVVFDRRTNTLIIVR